MRYSQGLFPTLKETPAEAEVINHKLMIRAGLIRKLQSGAYSYLPLGFRVLKKVEKIIREEMDGAGAQEVLLPALQPAELWKKTGRYETLGEDMVKFIDRHGKENVLGPTHEEVITALAANEIKSYRQLPITLYQIQTKFRDEARPRFGVIRSREFIMKDAYSFNRNQDDLDQDYQKMYQVYEKIFKRAGLKTVAVEADTGIMGGDVSHEFVVLTPNIESGIELGHLFKLGTKYSKKLGARYLAEDGTERDILMGCYGIGLNRIIAAAIEVNHDDRGIIWPMEIAPYQIAIVPLNKGNDRLLKEAETIYQALTREGFEVLLDDRDERAGVKLKDADLIGLPIRITIGEKSLSKGKIEIQKRSDKKPQLVDIKEVKKAVKKLLDRY